jgi:hypothetical protein
MHLQEGLNNDDDDDAADNDDVLAGELFTIFSSAVDCALGLPGGEVEDEEDEGAEGHSDE